jgi:hypothetical protein
MRLKYTFIFLLVLLFTGDSVFAQTTPTKSDSLKIYRDIEQFSNKSKTTRFIHRIFFKPVDIPKEQRAKNDTKRLQVAYKDFEGKIIRNIRITPLDPFGYVAADTTARSRNVLYDIGNRTHIKTQRMTIKNLLLIKKNEPFDSLLVKESERLIRSQNYVQEVFFYFESKKNSDSVDVFIRVIDKWSLIPRGSISTSSFTIGLKEINFMGLGHEFTNVFTRNYDLSNNSFSTNYYIPNIKNTYINTTLFYGINEHQSILRGLTVDRPFYSPLAKWAGGFSLVEQFQSNSSNETIKAEVKNIRYNIQDYWAGHAWQIFRGNTEDDRTTNLVLNGRFLRVHYRQKPDAFLDTLNLYANENFYLGSVGISRRRYVKDKYVFNFGFTEDVPVGNVYELTGGYQEKSTGRLYAGARITSGNYSDWGYLAWHLEYGGFLRASEVEQGVFAAGIDYFTKLLQLGRWHFRQFIKPQFITGINRFSYEKITINNEYGLRGFSATEVNGTKKILLTLQTQSYSPLNILGFRFGPYLSHSLGMLGNETSGFKNSKIFSQLGLGVLIKNDFLVYNVFQVSIAFYPTIPGEGENIFKINAIATTDFGLKDYVIGKPVVFGYQ